MLLFNVIPPLPVRGAESKAEATVPDRAAMEKELADLEAKLKEMEAHSKALIRQASAARAQHEAAQARGKTDNHLAEASRKEEENKRLVREMTPIRSRIAVLKNELGIDGKKKKKKKR